MSLSFSAHYTIWSFLNSVQTDTQRGKGITSALASNSKTHNASQHYTPLNLCRAWVSQLTTQFGTSLIQCKLTHKEERVSPVLLLAIARCTMLHSITLHNICVEPEFLSSLHNLEFPEFSTNLIHKEESVSLVFLLTTWYLTVQEQKHNASPHYFP